MYCVSITASTVPLYDAVTPPSSRVTGRPVLMTMRVPLGGGGTGVPSGGWGRHSGVPSQFRHSSIVHRQCPAGASASTLQ